MVRDRLHELKSNSPYHDDDDIGLDIEVTTNLEENDIENVLNEFADARRIVQEIRGNTKSMKKLENEIANRIPTPQGATEEFEERREANMLLCQNVYNKMKKLEATLPFKDDFKAISRIKRYHFHFVREEFIDAWNEHEAFLVEYEERIKRMLKKQARIVNAAADEEELENLITEKKTSLFVANIVQETELARRQLQDITQRQIELEKIEKSLVEVRDMFLRISTLVMEQVFILFLL
uniref:Putative snare protein syntaxin 1 n=1 Tax=Nyssomyia neivai TaxID=330878 RepID=A0A1L8DB90_9DIPT